MIVELKNRKLEALLTLHPEIGLDFGASQALAQAIEDAEEVRQRNGETAPLVFNAPAIAAAMTFESDMYEYSKGLKAYPVMVGRLRGLCAYFDTQKYIKETKQ